METKKIELGDVKVTIRRMPPVLYHEYALKQQDGMGEQGHDASDEDRVFRNVALSRFVQEQVLPECVLEVETLIDDTVTKFEKSRKTAAMTSDPDAPGYYIGDLGMSRFTRLHGEVLRFTQDADATFRGGDEATASD